VIVVSCYADAGADAGTANMLVVELPYDLRKKSRLRAESRCGQVVGIFLARGNILADGDLLASEDGVLVRIEAARESVSIASSGDPLLLARAAYHLGNRHVPLQIELGRLTYQHDHVLDHMVEGLGLEVRFGREKFQPESGAYHGQSHGHEHGSDHGLHRHDHG